MAQQDDTAIWAKARATAVIRRPPPVVFAFVCDPRNDPQWLGNIRDARQLTSGPMGIGTRFRQSASFLGAPVEGEWEITEYTVGTCIRGRSVSGPFVFVRGYDCAAAGPDTLITKHVDVRLTGALAFLAHGAATSLLSKASERALARLKAILEQ